MMTVYPLTDYIIIKSYNIEACVNNKLSLGWICLGGVQIEHINNKTLFYQAMAKP